MRCAIVEVVWADAGVAAALIELCASMAQAELNILLRARCAAWNSCWFGQLEAIAK